MSHDHSNSTYNRYATLADEASIHSVTDSDERSITTEQAIADEDEQLRIEQALADEDEQLQIGLQRLEDELRSLDDNIREFSSNLSKHSSSSSCSSSSSGFDLDDDEMTSTFQVLEMKKELRGKAVGVIVRADVQQF